MKKRFAGVLCFAGILSLASTRSVASAPSIVEDVSIDARPEAVVIHLKTTAPTPRYTCALAAGEFIVDLPDATGRLKADYPTGSDFVQSVEVESGPSGVGVRVRLSLKQGELTGIEHTNQGLRLRFTPIKQVADGEAVVDYRIGVGDKLDIAVFGQEELTRTVEVQEDGTVNFPLVGMLAVAGKSTPEVDDELTRVLGRDFLVEPDVNVSVREYKSRWVTILGEVRTPGRYELRRNMRLIDLLAEAGGATKEAGTQILVTRHADNGAPATQIQVQRERLLRGVDQRENVTLAHGDIVTVAEQDVYYIRGEVAKPGPYYLSGGMTVLKAIGMAGGLSQFANRKSIELLRSGEHGFSEKVVLNLKAIEDGKTKDVEIRPNDIIIVPRRIF